MENRAVAYFKLCSCLHCSERAKGRKEGQKGAPASIRVNGKTQTWHLGQSDLQSFALLPLSAPTNLRSDPLWLLFSAALYVGHIKCDY